MSRLNPGRHVVFRTPTVAPRQPAPAAPPVSSDLPNRVDSHPRARRGRSRKARTPQDDRPVGAGGAARGPQTRGRGAPGFRILPPPGGEQQDSAGAVSLSSALICREGTPCSDLKVTAEPAGCLGRSRPTGPGGDPRADIGVQAAAPASAPTHAGPGPRSPGKSPAGGRESAEAQPW
nr:synapsin-1-like [Pongo pygmaeus]